MSAGGLLLSLDHDKLVSFGDQSGFHLLSQGPKCSLVPNLDQGICCACVPEYQAGWMRRFQRLDRVRKDYRRLTIGVSDAPCRQVSVEEPFHLIMAGRQRLARGEEIERKIQLNLSLGDSRKRNRHEQGEKRLTLQNFIGTSS
jgi:hypothetical protein